MYTNRVFGAGKCVLFIEVSSFQDVGKMIFSLVIFCNHRPPSHTKVAGVTSPGVCLREPHRMEETEIALEPNFSVACMREI